MCGSVITIRNKNIDLFACFRQADVMDKLTDLEGAAMAEIAKRGQATRYLVKELLARSPSEFWSGSAGAVYPAIERLTARGLLLATASARGKRKHVEYCLTPAGRAALEDWLLDADRASGMGFDPLRTRLVSLGLVSPERRAAFLAQVRAATKAFAARPAFPDDPLALEIHHSWLAARAGWLEVLDFVAD